MVMKSQASRRLRGKPPARCTLQAISWGPAILLESVVLRMGARAEFSQTGEVGSSSCADCKRRSNGVRHVARVTGSSGRILCLIEA